MDFVRPYDVVGLQSLGVVVEFFSTAEKNLQFNRHSHLALDLSFDVQDSI